MPAVFNGGIKKLGFQAKPPVLKVCIHLPRTDGIHPDVKAGQFFGHHLCEHDDAGLGYGIGPVKQRRHLAGSGGGVDDGTGFSHHHGHNGPGHAENTMKIDIDGFHPGIFIVGMNGIGHPKGGACIIAQHVNMIMPGLHQVKHPANGRIAGDIHSHRHCINAKGLF